jgi:Tfp pilus assembly protein PilV
MPPRKPRILIATRILGAGALSLIVLTVALLGSARETVRAAMYAQIAQHIGTAQKYAAIPRSRARRPIAQRSG